MRKLIISLPVVLFLIASFWTSCKKDDLQTLTKPDEVCDTCHTGVCDTTFVVSYTNDIVPILLGEDCLTCHNQFSAPDEAEGNVLEGYSALIAYVEDSTLMKAITHSDPDNVEPMPDGGDKISDCKIARIEAWIRQGYPNN